MKEKGVPSRLESCQFVRKKKDKHQVKKDQPPNNLRLINEFLNTKKNTAGFLNGFKSEIKKEA